MNTFIVLAAVVAAAQAGIVSIAPAGFGPSHFVRAPAHDSASIESHRLGGNFAYSTAEAHAFARVTPQLSTAVHPVAETTYVHEPAPIATVVPAPIVNTHHAARAVFGQHAVYAQEPVYGPVATHTDVHHPIVKSQHLVHHAPTVAYAQPAPIAAPAYHAAPAFHAAAPAFDGHYGYAGLPNAYAGGYAGGYAGFPHGFAAPAVVA